MTTPLIIVCLLTSPWLLAKFTGRSRQTLRNAGTLGLTLVFCFTGVGHFIETKSMAEMIPPWLPGRVAAVYVTGVLEILLACLVLKPTLRRQIGWVLLAMLILLLPWNIYAAIERVPMGGHAWGPVYLAIRFPLQLLLMAWTYWFAVRGDK
jgi:uncharacterized membrane protein